jgi:uncharacterized protein (DUF2236 family)
MSEEITSQSVSPEKLQANRDNAKRSTGPRTPRGKRNSRRNALKHGLLSKDLVISSGEGKESAKEFQDLLSQLKQDLQPVGRAEESLVEIVASCDWRFRRALRAEAGEITNGFAEEERLRLRQVDRNLPGQEATDKVLRYQTTILRQRRRAMEELEQLQRRREARRKRNHERDEADPDGFSKRSE